MPNKDLSTRDFVLSLGSILVVAGVWFQFDLGSARLSQSHEVRVLETAREMESRGDYLTPWFLGRPRWQKPPLAYYTTSWVQDRDEPLPSSGRRLVAALGVITILALACLVVTVESRAVARLAATIFAGGFLVMREFRLVTTDPYLTGLSLVSTAALVVAMHRVRPGSGWVRGFGIGALSLAFLAKGPLAWLLVGLPVLWLAPREWAWRQRWKRLGVDLLGSLVPAGIWLLLLAWKAPEAFATFAAELRERVPDANPERARGITTYGLTLVYLVMPATIPFFAALLTKSRWSDRWIRWFVCGLAFFLVLASKKDAYLLPLAAPAAVMAAKWWMDAEAAGGPVSSALVWAQRHLVPLAALFFAGWTVGHHGVTADGRTVLTVLAAALGIAGLMVKPLQGPWPIASLGILVSCLILTQFRVRKPDDAARESLGFLVRGASRPDEVMAFDPRVEDAVIAYYARRTPVVLTSSGAQETLRESLRAGLILMPVGEPMQPGFRRIALIPSRGAELWRRD